MKTDPFFFFFFCTDKPSKKNFRGCSCATITDMENKSYSSTSPAMEADEILAVHSMLHLIFHRNKNQHGRMKWWKWLSILKSVTGNLSACLNSDSPSERELSAESHKRYLTTLVVPRCYL